MFERLRRCWDGGQSWCIMVIRRLRHTSSWIIIDVSISSQPSLTGRCSMSIACRHCLVCLSVCLPHCRCRLPVLFNMSDFAAVCQLMMDGVALLGASSCWVTSSCSHNPQRCCAQFPTTRLGRRSVQVGVSTDREHRYLIHAHAD